MIVKKYIVNDMREALVRAKYELGSEAVIISHRKVKDKKWYNLFKKKKVEVTVAIEDDTKYNFKEITKFKEYLTDINNNESSDKLKENEMNKQQLEKNIPQIINEECNEKSEDIVNNSPKEMELSFISEEIENLTNKLSFNKVMKLEFGKYCNHNNIDTNNIDKNNIKNFIKEYIDKSTFNNTKDFGRIIAFIGPTGVGKTTTIAKIAARESLLNGKKVGLITMDTYRIGAVAQLRTYAEILGVPLEVVQRKEEMQKKISKLKDCELILIDSVGINYKREDHLNNINDYLSSNDSVQKCLVISMTTDNKGIPLLLESYKKLNYESVIITKLDEMHDYKNIWYVGEKCQSPIKYFCAGQDVPEDIEDVSSINIFKYIWGEVEK